jgi:hypothetical protein
VVPRRNANVRGVHQHMVRERLTPEGEQYIVTPPGVVCGGEVQRDRDERMDVLHCNTHGVIVVSTVPLQCFCGGCYSKNIIQVFKFKFDHFLDFSFKSYLPLVKELQILKYN